MFMANQPAKPVFSAPVAPTGSLHFQRQGRAEPGLVVPGLTEAVVPHKELSGFATSTGKNKRMSIVYL